MFQKMVPSCNFAKRMYSAATGKVKAQKYVLTKYFQGEPKKSDFKIVEEELPELKEGGNLVLFFIFLYRDIGFV